MTAPRRRLAVLALLALVVPGARAQGGEAPVAPVVGTPAATSTYSGPVATAPRASRAPAPDVVDGLSRIARTEGERLILSVAGGEIDYLVGVNVGPTVPGAQPGELAVPREVWRRWIAAIADAGFHALRVYTVQMPVFYQELREHNLANPDRALYLVHGVWLAHDTFEATEDLFEPALRARMRQDILDAVAAVHGEAVLPPRPGYASGTFDADVSPWLLSWAVGVEMDPLLTLASDRHNAGVAPYRGRYLSSTDDASPTETWLAEMLDVVAGASAARGVTMPLTFTNWPTTDPLSHPAEPLPREDLVGIDANHVAAHATWPGGYYASYHAYPYYPDFQRYEPGIADFAYRGRVDPYAGYLAKLRQHHRGMPLVVLETGVPGALGSAHHGPLGRDQGGHDERTQMAIDAELLELTHDLGAAGGFLFAWADEWFKFTWNTIDLELPADRRQLWHNPLTNESFFGLLAIEDARPVPRIGTADGWDGVPSQVIHEGRGHLREIRAAHDSAYLYLRVTLDRPEAWLELPLTLGFDLVPGGNGGLAGVPGVGAGADTAFVVSEAGAFAYVRASNDVNDRVYGAVLGFHPVSEAAMQEGSGVWNPQRLITNRPFRLPVSGEERPAEWFDLDPLPRGVSDPDHPAFDSRAVWAASGRVVDLRLPHAMVGFADPSSLLGLVVGSDGAIGTAPVERIGITLVQGDEVVETDYGWDPWNRVTWRERPKAGFDRLSETVRRLAEPSPRRFRLPP